MEVAAAGAGAHGGGGEDEDWAAPPRPLSQDTAISEAWGLVRAGCLEGEARAKAMTAL